LRQHMQNSSAFVSMTTPPASSMRSRRPAGCRAPGLCGKRIRRHLGIVPPGQALASALAGNLDAPWVNGERGADG
jgi:hypothetical protein